MFTRQFGGATLLNPRRYGAMRMEDYARYRLSIFTREESAAIVAYLEYHLEHEEIEELRKPTIAALDRFWRERAKSAPVAESLRAHLAAESEYLEAIRQKWDKRE